MNTMSEKAVRPRKADYNAGEWIQGVDDEEMTIEDEEILPGEEGQEDGESTPAQCPRS